MLLIVNHLGRKPKKGGNPAKDRKFNIKKNFKFFLKENSIEICQR